MLTYSPGTRWRRDLNNFYQGICEQPFRAGLPAPGILQTLLKQGEYGVLGNVPIFESTFVQVTKRGEYIGIHNNPNVVTMGILASSPRMLLPDLLIIAQEKKIKDQKTKELEIKRLIPLELVDIFVHNLSKRRLKLQMITGRKYYLQLCGPEGEENFLFERWIRLIYLLRATRARGNVRTPVTSTDPTLRTIWKNANIPRQHSSGSKKQHTLSSIKIKDSAELFRDHQKQKKLETWKYISHTLLDSASAELSTSPANQSYYNSLAQPTQKGNVQRGIASKQKILKSEGMAGYSSQGTLGLSASEGRTSREKSKVSVTKSPSQAGRTSREKSKVSVTKSPSQAVSRNATQQSVYGLGSQTGPPTSRRSSPSLKPSKSKHASVRSSARSHASVDVESPEFSILFTNIEPSVPFIPSETSGPSKPGSQMSAREHKQTKRVGWPSVSKVEGSARSSLESEPPVIKLQKSQKSRSLVETTGLASEMGQSHSEKKHATEPQVNRPSSRGGGGGGGKGPASQNSSRKQSQHVSKAASTRASAASTAPKYHASVSGGPVGQSEASRATLAKSRASERSAFTTPGSQSGNKASRASSGKSRTSDTNAKPLEAVNKEKAAGIGDRPVSREASRRSKPSKEYRTQTASVKSPKPSKATSRRSQTSASPSPERGHSTSRSPDRKKAVGSQMHRTTESDNRVSQADRKAGGVGPSERVSVDRHQSQALETDKRKELEMRSSREKSKSGKQKQPSSSKGQQESSGAQVHEKKLKSALSSAKQRSSLTFVTIYSVLSSSLERIKGAKNDESKILPVTSNPSKRVTISGVTGPTGKTFLQEETGLGTSTGTPGGNEGSNVAATPAGTEASEAGSPSQDHASKAAGASGANTTAVKAGPSTGGRISRAAQPSRPGTPREPSVARSVTPQKPSRRKAGQSSAPGRKGQTKAKKALAAPKAKLPRSKPSEKSAFTRDASKKMKVASHPPRAKKSIHMGHSEADTVPVAAGSTGDGSRAWEQEEPRVQSQKRSRRDENQRPSSQPSAGPSKPASSVSRMASQRSTVTGPKDTPAAVRSQQQSQTSPRERTSSAPVGHVSEGVRKSKASKKSVHRLQSHLPLDAGHSRLNTESVDIEGFRMDRVTKAAGPSNLSSKTRPILQDSRLFRPGGWVDFVEMGDKEWIDKRPSSPRSNTAAPSRPSSQAARVMTRPSSRPAIHASGDTRARSGL